MIGGRSTRIPAPASRSVVKSWQFVRSDQSWVDGHQQLPGRMATGSPRATQVRNRAWSPYRSLRLTGNAQIRTMSGLVPPQRCTHQSTLSIWTPPSPGAMASRRAARVPEARPLIQCCSPKCTATQRRSTSAGSISAGRSPCASMIPLWKSSANTRTRASGWLGSRTTVPQPPSNSTLRTIQRIAIGCRPPLGRQGACPGGTYAAPSRP